MVENVTEDEETRFDRAFEILNPILLFLLLFGFAATVHYEGLLKAFRSKGVLIGLFMQYLVMPLVGFTLVKILPDLDDVSAVVLLVITSSPGGAFSNFYNSLFNGDLSLSVAMTTISTVCCVVLLPLNMLIYINAGLSSSADLLDWGALLETVGILLASVICGVTANYYLPAWTDVFNYFSTCCGLVLIGLTLFTSNDDEPLWEKPWQIYILAMTPTLFGLIVAFFISVKVGLTRPEVFAVGIEISMQNTALAISFGVQAFKGDDRKNALAVPVLYGVSSFIFGTLFAINAFFSGWTYTPKDAGIIPALLNNYQPKRVALLEDVGKEEGENEDVSEPKNPSVEASV